MNIVFFGSDEFSVIVLDKLLRESQYNIVKVVTTKTLTPIAIYAKRNFLPLLQTSKPKTSDFVNLNSQLGILVVYGHIISKNVLDLFSKGIINIHPSILPKYRGPSPIKTSLLNGDKQTGVTIIELDDQMDHGRVLIQTNTNIEPHELLEQLRDRLARLGTDILIKILPDYIQNKVTLHQQDHKQATFTKQFTKSDGKITWGMSVKEIYNKYRAFHDWPGIWFEHKDKRVKILECKLVDDKLEIITVQPEGKNSMDFKAFINGYGNLAIRP